MDDNLHDRQIQELAKMVLEMEALDAAAAGRDADAPLATIGPRASAPRLGLSLGAGLAAAACLVIGFVAMRPAPTKAPVKGGEFGLGGPTGPTNTKDVVAAPAPEESCVVMALFHDASGHCSCLQVSEPTWDGGRKLADVSRGELRRVALSEPCDSQAQQVLIVAVSGRTDTLPRKQEQAEAIVQQLSTAAGSIGRHTDVSQFARAAMPGLSDGATVVAESMSMRQPSRVKDLLEGATAGWK